MRIFTKLFLLIGAVAAVPIVLGALAVSRQSEALDRDLVHLSGEVSQRTITIAATELRSQAQKAHIQVVTDKASELTASFAAIRRAVLLEAALVRQALATDPSGSAPPRFPVAEVIDRLGDGSSDFATRVHGREPYAMYHLAPGVEEARVAPTLERLRPLGVFFAVARRDLPGCVSTYVGHRDGIMFGYPGESLIAPEFDPRTRPWYRRALEERRLIWTEPYFDRNRRDRVITCAAPVIEAGAAEPVAVAAMDMRLSEVIAKLIELPGLRAAEALLVDGAGRVLLSRADLAGAGPEGASANAQLPPITSFRGGTYSHVFDAIRREEAAGVMAGAVQGGLGICAFSSVTLPGEEGAGLARWHYIVDTRPDDVTRPVEVQEAKVRDAIQPLARTVHARLGDLGAAVIRSGAAVLLLALVVAALAARSTTRPLLEVADVAHKVGAGDLGQHVNVRSRDEIGRMGEAINEMIKGLREREFVKSTFKRYVSASVVDDLIRAPDKVKLGGDKRDMTVFFCDLAGFTTVSESLTPEELVEVMNEYLGAMTETILGLEGTVDKYIGDAVMAFWGAPNAQADHALRACKAALRGQAKLEELRVGWGKRGIHGVEVRTGINSGPMVVGNMGSAAQMNYTVMGDAVNLGSRLEGTNKAYGTRILISEATRAAAGAAIETREIDAIAVKGKRQAVRVYELLGLAGEVPEARRAACRAFEEGLAHYRARRWDEAQASFERASEGPGGDGPTRLFMERVARFRAEPPPADWDGTYVAKEK